MFKLPEKYRKSIREYRNMSPEEKEGFENGFIEYAREKSPILRNSSDEELRRHFKILSSLVDTREE
ncbi:hypothetical protein MTQ89_08305 [Staphylococcus hyicus]|uniref:DUF7366 family protein n=1 Tax=Staphylococcus hyicus TaxID=1284 RepID=UPI00208FCD73|nr:hypothetical protein [Staphylococcus hyicus]MCO4330307.1 hypothetical protein [Staphylococcus hyicus]MCO4336739.1 hypothetical protein [Staphylococcus hyicus]